MRKLIVLLLGLIFLALPRAEASVSNMTAQLGVYNSTDGTYGLEVDNNNQFHFSQTGSGIWYPGVDATTNVTLTANQSGQTIVQNNTTYNNVQFTLPTAQVGMTFTFIVDVAKTIKVLPQSTDTINYSSLTAGQSITNTSAAKGDHLQLICVSATNWSIVDQGGTWAHGSP